MQMILISVLLITIFSTVFNFYLTKTIILIAGKYNLSFYTEERRHSLKNKSRIGGVGILLTQIIFFFIAQFIFNNFLRSYILIPYTLLFTVFSFSFIGLIDDLFNISPFYRLFFQISISIISWNQGLRLELLNHSNYLIEQFSIFDIPIVSLLLTVLWIAGLTNAINWLDGLDGLAGSFSLLVFLIFGMIFLNFNDYSMALICFTTIGACNGFLRNNLFPSKIFMGDGGSYFLGSLLACTTISLNLRIIDNQFLINRNNILFIPLLIFSIPILDMIFVVFSRVLNNLSPFYPDKSHFHHKLRNNGLSVNDIVLFYLGITQWLGFIIMYLLNIHFVSIAIMIISYFLFFLISIIYSLKIKKFRSIN